MFGIKAQYGRQPFGGLIMPRLLYFDSSSPVLALQGVSDPPHPPDTITTRAGDEERKDSLTQRQLAAIGEFRRDHPESEMALLEDFELRGRSVRDLAEMVEYSCNPGTISRRVNRMREKLRIHVLADSQEFLLGSLKTGFTLCPRKGALVEGVDGYAVSLKETDKTFRFAPSYLQCYQFLNDVWRSLNERYCDGFGVPISDRYLGGWIADDEQYELNVSILIKDFQLAQKIAWENNQQSIFHLLTGKTFKVMHPAQAA
tara:strand:- start:53167 stop:53940 length:774 start_codon:yes stop_codon:yes gene_type:complete